MIIKCGICNNKIEVDDSIVDGQHVLCPFCGNKSAYSKPRRIELPTGIRRPQQIKGGASTESEGTPVKAEKPKLAIKRSTQGLADVDLNAQAIMTRLRSAMTRLWARAFIVAMAVLYCGGRGLRGRLALFEFLRPNAEIAAAIAEGANDYELRKLVKRYSFRSMLDDGIRKCQNGTTTVAEVARVAYGC